MASWDKRQLLIESAAAIWESGVPGEERLTVLDGSVRHQRQYLGTVLYHDQKRTTGCRGAGLRGRHALPKKKPYTQPPNERQCGQRWLRSLRPRGRLKVVCTAFLWQRVAGWQATALAAQTATSRLWLSFSCTDCNIRYLSVGVHTPYRIAILYCTVPYL